MPLHPQAKALIDELGFDALDVSVLTPPDLREAFKAMPGASTPGEPVAKVENREIPGPAGVLRVRIYTPNGRAPFPLLVYYHGGGFVICDLDSHDATCRGLANAAGCVVVSVDYRLAPEAKFPAGPDDCYAAACWVAENAASLDGDATRLAVAGDSAGGCLAAVVAQTARERGGPALVHQLLIYPVTNHDFETESYQQNASGYLLTREMMMWFWGHYLERPEDGEQPLASPLRATSFAGLPPATVITAEFDPLRDEGEAYAARLRAAGVATELKCYDGMIHGFFAMTEILDGAREAVSDAAAALRRAFGG